MSYVELHAHSCYSFLDGASQPAELAARAAELGYEAFALTDHDGLSGSLEFAHAAREAGLRPITGCEVTLEDGSHLTLLVETQAGYRNLCRLITLAHVEDRRSPSPPSTPAGCTACRAAPATGWWPGRWRRAGWPTRSETPACCAASLAVSGSRSSCSGPTGRATPAATGC
jgi:error-prone DNA polymerase